MTSRDEFEQTMYEMYDVSPLPKHDDGRYHAPYAAHFTVWQAALSSLPRMTKEEIALVIFPTAFESWQASFDYQIREGETPEKAKEFADWCDNGRGAYSVKHALEIAGRLVANLPHIVKEV